MTLASFPGRITTEETKVDPAYKISEELVNTMFPILDKDRVREINFLTDKIVNKGFWAIPIYRPLRRWLLKRQAAQWKPSWEDKVRYVREVLRALGYPNPRTHILVDEELVRRVMLPAHLLAYDSLKCVNYKLEIHECDQETQKTMTRELIRVVDCIPETVRTA